MSGIIICEYFQDNGISNHGWMWNYLKSFTFVVCMFSYSNWLLLLSVDLILIVTISLLFSFLRKLSFHSSKKMKSFLFNRFQWLLNEIMPYTVSTNFYSKWAMFQITIINWKREHFLYSTKDPSQSLFWNQNFLLYLSNNNNRGLSLLKYQNSNLFFVLIDVPEII